MNKDSKKTLTSAAVGAALGASVGYAIGAANSSTPCEGCSCELGEKKKTCIDKIRKQKEEYIAHKASNQCFTNPCDSCPHKI
jgi:hypothetical protein